MNILFFHRWVGVHYGGTEAHVRNLAQLLSRRGHHVSILTRQGRGLIDLDPQIEAWRVSKNPFESDFSYEESIPLYFHTSLFIIKSFFYLLFLILIKRVKVDVVSVHFVTEAVVARLIRMIFSIPYVFVLEGYTGLEAKEAKRANQTIAISLDEVKRVRQSQGYSPEFIPVGIDSNLFSLPVEASPIRQKYLGRFDKIVLSVGRLESRKDFPTLIRSARLLRDKSKKYRFLIIGDGIDRQKIEDLIKDQSLEDQVLMLGAVEESLKAQIYQASDLFVLPTLYEGFGIVFAEAMACGLPVVSTNVGALPEVVDGAGILVEPRDPELLASAIEKILDDPCLYADLRVQALKVAPLYYWENLIEKYENVYRSIVRK